MATDRTLKDAKAPSKEQQQQQQSLPEKATTSPFVLSVQAAEFVPSVSVHASASVATNATKPIQKKEKHNRNNRFRGQPRDPDHGSDTTPNDQRNKSRRRRRPKRPPNQQMRENASPGDDECNTRPSDKTVANSEKKRTDRHRRSEPRNNKDRRRKKPKEKSKSKTKVSEHPSHSKDRPQDEDEREVLSASAFPALALAPSPLSFSRSSNSQHVLWKAFSEILEQQQEEDANPATEEMSASWQNGLDPLEGGTQARNGRRRRMEYSAWDDEDEGREKNASEDDQDDNDGDDEPDKPRDAASNATIDASSLATITADLQISSGSWKRTFDMDKLRDRWWMAVAKQQERRIRLREEEEEEEQQQQQQQQQSDEEEANEYVHAHYSAHEGEFSEDANGEDSSQNDGIHLAAIQSHVQSNPAFHQTTTSKKDLLDSIIEQNDDQALREMLTLSFKAKTENLALDHVDANTSQNMPFDALGVCTKEGEQSTEDLVEFAIDVTIRRNNPTMLRAILSVSKGRIPINSQPLIQAAKLNREECASILLSKEDRDSTMLFQKDEVDGSTALHYCCRKEGDKGMLVLLLKQLAGNTKGKRQQLSKLVTATNKKLQTPLHVACESGRNDLVEAFLTICKSTLFCKVLSMEDAERQTPLLTAVGNNSCDVVVTLLMWRGNHDHQRQKKNEKYSVAQNLMANDKHTDKKVPETKRLRPTCPLVWAARHANLDMIEVLIQFGDQSGTVYRVTEALFVLLRSDASNEIKLKGSGSLVLVGANPFEEILSAGDAGREKESAISVAAKVGPNEIICSIMSTAMRMIKDRQLARRRDPVLRKQPEAFFQTLESKEDLEARSAMTYALIETLFRAYSNQDLKDFSTAITFYEQLDVVDESYLTRLQASILTGTLRSCAPERKNWCLVATYRHSVSAVGVKKAQKRGPFDQDRSAFYENSLRLLEFQWVENQVNETVCYCPWMKRNLKERSQMPLDFHVENEVILLAEDGSEFLVDANIASRKSGKLASAFRFAEMNQDKNATDGVIKLEVSIPPDFCKLLIQHMYHGSICCGWPNLRGEAMCRYLLELMVVAEEFIIPSLVQEIEMRLMSSKPKRCFCWNCCQALRVISSDIGQHEAECLYTVDGNSSIVTHGNVTDILGVTEYIGGLDYNICLAPMVINECIEPRRLWANYDKGMQKNEKDHWKVNKAAVCLREFAVITTLKEFASVVRNPGFFLASEEVLDKQSQKQLLLQMCLDELQNNSIIAAAYIRPWKTKKSKHKSFDN